MPVPTFSPYPLSHTTAKPSAPLQGGVFYGLERFPFESGFMYLVVGLAKLLAIACTVQAGFRVSKPPFCCDFGGYTVQQCGGRQVLATDI